MKPQRYRFQDSPLPIADEESRIYFPEDDIEDEDEEQEPFGTLPPEVAEDLHLNQPHADLRPRTKTLLNDPYDQRTRTGAGWFDARLVSMNQRNRAFWRKRT